MALDEEHRPVRDCRAFRRRNVRAGGEHRVLPGLPALVHGGAGARAHGKPYTGDTHGWRRRPEPRLYHAEREPARRGDRHAPGLGAVSQVRGPLALRGASARFLPHRVLPAVRVFQPRAGQGALAAVRWHGRFDGGGVRAPRSPGMKVEVIYALPAAADAVSVSLTAGATLRDAVLASGMLERHPEISLEKQAFGI